MYKVWTSDITFHVNINCCANWLLVRKLFSLQRFGLLDVFPLLVVPSWKPLGMLRPCTIITQVVLESLSSSTFPRTEPFREAVSLTVSFSSSLKFAVNHVYSVIFTCNIHCSPWPAIVRFAGKGKYFFLQKNQNNPFTTYFFHIFS